ncbi:hypothetical protein AOL_s00078g565 [Orbilia oligospora ATCC 24927]|uniref:Uncharacterized protein n=1 Tax=Arthrobotrys oligospora (strain ATCC 24927 / CBS 115.81 / DSM 1491) TaxID=756982 RepID=G1XCB8_ARTOA|nr:hypothetical protein AOL_s00078g565 [Orbilia oligospora ATCC 24927]EGX49181.1 hypothetical protein AOL_s00078g565 [Orbilia oligospora ATCC 24927]
MSFPSVKALRRHPEAKTLLNLIFGSDTTFSNGDLKGFEKQPEDAHIFCDIQPHLLSLTIEVHDLAELELQRSWVEMVPQNNNMRAQEDIMRLFSAIWQ